MLNAINYSDDYYDYYDMTFILLEHDTQKLAQCDEIQSINIGLNETEL